MEGRETFAPEDETQIDLEEMIAKASDGDRAEREAIQEIDARLDLEIPEFLRRT